MAANIFQAGGGGLWGATASWSLGAVPTANDGNVATFNGTSPNCTVDASARVCNSISFTGYTNTITMTNTITSSGSVTLAAGMTIAGASDLIVNATATLTSNGKTWPNGLGIGTLGGVFTVTLADNWTLTGAFSTLVNVTLTLNGNTLFVAGNFSVPTGTVMTGTTVITLNTSTSQTYSTRNDVNCNMGNDLTFNATGTINVIASAGFGYVTGRNMTITYTAGTVVFAGSVNFNPGFGFTMTLNTGTLQWSSINAANFQIWTLSSNINTTGTLTVSNFLTINGAFNANVASLVASTQLDGTSTLVFNSTGTWSGAGAVKLNTIINTAGTLTVSGTVVFNTGTLTYTAGTVIVTSSTLSITSSATLNTSGMTWNNIQTTILIAAFTITSALNVGGNFTQINTCSFVGAFNINVAGNLTLDTVTANASTFNLVGGGTFNAVSAVGGTFTINTTGAITIGTVSLSGSTLNYTTGTITTGVGTLTLVGVSTLNMNGATLFTVNLTGVSTITNSSILNVLGTLTLGSAGQVTTINGSSINALSNLSIGGTISVISGTTNINMTGIGTLSSTQTTGTFSNNLAFNTTGTITISGNVNYQTGTLTHTASASIITEGSTLTITGTATLDVGAISWNNFKNTNGAYTITLTSDLNIVGSYTCATSGSPTTTFTGSTVNIAGSLTFSNAGSIISGTSLFYLTGNGTVSGSGTISANLTFIASGKIILDTTTFGAATFTYVSGLISCVNSSVFTLLTGASFVNCHRIPFKNITVTSGASITVNKMFNGTGSAPITITPSSTTNYTINVTDHETRCEFVRFSNCTASPAGSIISSTINGDKGNNIGVSFLNPSFRNGFVDQDQYLLNNTITGYINHWGETPQGFVTNY